MRERFNAKQSYGTSFTQLSRPTFNRHTQTFGCFAAAVECRSGQLGAMKIDPEVFSTLIKDKTLSGNAFKLWHYFMGKTGRNECAWPSMDTICKDMDYSRPALVKYIRELEAKGYVSITRGTQHSSSCYRVSSSLNELQTNLKLLPAVKTFSSSSKQNSTSSGKNYLPELSSTELNKRSNTASDEAMCEPPDF